MIENIRPARAVAPGRIILRELEARGWTQQDLAAIIDRPEQAISEIVNAKKQITAATARQLAMAFGTTPDLWLNLEMNFQLNQTRQDGSESVIRRRSFLYNLAPINEMIRRGWIEKSNNIEDLEKEYCQFFNLHSVTQNANFAFRTRRPIEREPENQAILAWIKRVQNLAAHQPAGSFSKKAFPQLINQLLALSKNASDVEKVPSLLFSYGVHFAYLPHLSKTYLDGAAFWLNNEPVIAITLRYDRIDAFWFTLLHEIAHIYLKHKDIFVDQLYDHDSSHFEEEESQANQLASNWLIPDAAMQEFIEENQPRFSRQEIEAFALEQERHPGIIVGQLMYRKALKYSQMRDQLVKVSSFLEQWQDVPIPIS